MRPPEQVLKELSDLYEFHRRLKSYRLKEGPSSIKAKETKAKVEKSSDTCSS